MLSGNAPDVAGRLHDHDPAPEPGWIAALRAPADFVEGVIAAEVRREELFLVS